MRWAGDFLTGAMRDWPDRELEIGSLFGEDGVNAFPASRFAATAEERDERRGRFIATMRWKLAADEALILEFDDYDGLLDVHEHGHLLEQHGLPVPARELHTEPHRRWTPTDACGSSWRTTDPGCHNWIDTQGFERGVPDLPERPEPAPSRRSRRRSCGTTSSAAHLPDGLPAGHAAERDRADARTLRRDPAPVPDVRRARGS